MKTMKTTEDLLAEALARCQASIATCLAKADSTEPKACYNRGIEIERAVALLKASAHVADSLARLRGQHIRVTREGVPEKRGSNGLSSETRRLPVAVRNRDDG